MTPTEKRNALLCIVGEACWGLQSAFIVPMTMITLVLRHYGAGARTIGTMMAIESCFLVLPQIVGLLWFRTHGARKKPLIIWHLLTVIPAIAMYGIVVLTLDGHASPATIRVLFLLSFAVLMTSIGVVLGAWMDWIARLFHKGIRGSIMGWVSFATSAASALGGLLAGRILQNFPGVQTYGWLFITASIIAALAILLFGLIVDPPLNPAARPPSLQDLLARFRISLGNRNFRDFLAGRLLAAFGFSIGPFVAVHFQSAAHGGLPDGTLVLCGTAATCAAALTNIILGRIGDKRGHRIGIVVGVVVQVLTLIFLLAGHGLPACILAYLGLGICGAAGTVSHTNLLFETCPHDHRLAHITAGNLVMALPLFIAPLLAGWFADRHGLRALFTASLAVSLLAALWTILRIRDPRDVALTEA